ncbi:hypothetical protein TNCV_1121431 [Trichonephila clavipes]|uniref:Uncharacterized protein n=1 Tax=Trichonephila clavipes TaxID=2585209 RepID=A0A8X6SVR1_TRICX|nr:hypothetical protein TNCV_1121431 [Trichonephila clavipes]
MATSSFMSHNYSSSQSEVPKDHYTLFHPGKHDTDFLSRNETIEWNNEKINYTRAFGDVILNHGRVTWTIPGLAPPSPNTNGRTFQLSTDLTCIAALLGGWYWARTHAMIRYRNPLMFPSHLFEQPNGHGRDRRVRVSSSGATKNSLTGAHFKCIQNESPDFGMV